MNLEESIMMPLVTQMVFIRTMSNTFIKNYPTSADKA